jgi:hypothetical protein
MALFVLSMFRAENIQALYGLRSVVYWHAPDAILKTGILMMSQLLRRPFREWNPARVILHCQSCDYLSIL